MTHEEEMASFLKQLEAARKRVADGGEGADWIALVESILGPTATATGFLHRKGGRE